LRKAKEAGGGEAGVAAAVNLKTPATSTTPSFSGALQQAKELRAQRERVAKSS
jgi:hypothetical protein